MKNKGYLFICALYPLFLILDAFVFNLGSFSSWLNDEHHITNRVYPQILSSLLVIFILPWIKVTSRLNKGWLLIIIFILIHFLLFSSKSIFFCITLILNLIFSYYLISNRNRYLGFNTLLISYTTISLLIMLYRLFYLGRPAIELRASINIWGGIDLVSLWILKFILDLKVNRTNNLLPLHFAFILSLLYISRTGVGICLVLYLLNVKKIKRKSLVYISVVLCTFFYIFYEYFEIVLTRFEIITINTLTESRGYIWNEANKIINNNPYGIGLSNYKNVSVLGFSNPHNILLDIFINFGIFFGSLLIIILFVNPIIQAIQNKKIILMASFLIWLMGMYIGGVVLFQVGGIISFFTFIGLSVLINSSDD